MPSLTGKQAVSRHQIDSRRRRGPAAGI